jgi:hypothetical protein
LQIIFASPGVELKGMFIKCGHKSSSEHISYSKTPVLLSSLRYMLLTINNPKIISDYERIHGFYVLFFSIT